MLGKIMKGIAGFYYVHTDAGIIECKAKGIFRKENLKPLVGDNVKIEMVDSGKLLGNICELFPRKNALIRPASANIDQTLVIFAVVKPNPNYNLLDRFLISMQRKKLPSIICFNKKDISKEEEREELKQVYEQCGCHILFVSAAKEEGMEELRELLQGKTTVVAGPSGVGKSSIINVLYPRAQMPTAEISRKIERGKHTTRHAELFALNEDTYIMDTPGFTSLNLDGMEKEELSGYYSEFVPYESNCRFGGCAHINEPVCGIKEALKDGKISRVRYENYTVLYEDLKNKKKY